jgi:hypothetical protein
MNIKSNSTVSAAALCAAVLTFSSTTQAGPFAIFRGVDGGMSRLSRGRGIDDPANHNMFDDRGRHRDDPANHNRREDRREVQPNDDRGAIQPGDDRGGVQPGDDRAGRRGRGGH